MEDRGPQTPGEAAAGSPGTELRTSAGSTDVGGSACLQGQGWLLRGPALARDSGCSTGRAVHPLLPISSPRPPPGQLAAPQVHLPEPTCAPAGSHSPGGFWLLPCPARGAWRDPGPHRQPASGPVRWGGQNRTLRGSWVLTQGDRDAQRPPAPRALVGISLVVAVTSLLILPGEDTA